MQVTLNPAYKRMNDGWNSIFCNYVGKKLAFIIVPDTHFSAPVYIKSG
jgi:hypothetical protein